MNNFYDRVYTDRIPDITERYPEGFGGESYDDYCNRNYARMYEDDYDDGIEIPNEAEEVDDPYTFEVGETYGVEDLYGGTTYYRCTRRTKNRVWFRSADWRAWVDNIDEREEQKYTIERNEYGDEEALIYHSDAYDFDCMVRAYMPDGYNNLRSKY